MAERSLAQGHMACQTVYHNTPMVVHTWNEQNMSRFSHINYLYKKFHKSLVRVVCFDGHLREAWVRWGHCNRARALTPCLSCLWPARHAHSQSPLAQRTWANLYSASIVNISWPDLSHAYRMAACRARARSFSSCLGTMYSWRHAVAICVAQSKAPSPWGVSWRAAIR